MSFFINVCNTIPYLSIFWLIDSNLEKGYLAHVFPANNSAHQTLVRQMNWLDRNMESLLQQPPAATVRFIANNRTTQEEQPVKQFIDATSKPIHSSTPVFKNEASTSKSAMKSEASSSQHEASSSQHEASSSKHEASSSKHEAGSSKPKATSKPVVKQEATLPNPIVKKEPTHKFTSTEISAAEKRRKHEIDQLQTRFCDNISTR